MLHDNIRGKTDGHDAGKEVSRRLSESIKYHKKKKEKERTRLVLKHDRFLELIIEGCEENKKYREKQIVELRIYEKLKKKNHCEPILGLITGIWID